MASMKKARYPHKTAVVYMSAITAAMSAIVAFMLLETIIMRIEYLVATSIITIATFILKFMLLTRRQEASEAGVETARWKTLIPTFFMLIAFLLLPLWLAGVLDPYVWFILMVSLTSGVSLAEILLYLQTR